MIRPLSGCVLLRLDPPEAMSKGGIAFPQRTLSAEEVQERNHSPTPPPPVTGKVLAIGPWKRLKNGMVVLPPFPPASKVLIRSGSGQQLSYGTDRRLRLVNIDDILAVLTAD